MSKSTGGLFFFKNLKINWVGKLYLHRNTVITSKRALRNSTYHLSLLSPLIILVLGISLNPIALFTQPDLIVEKARLVSDLRADLLDNNDACYINEGCVGGLGDRQLIRFSTHIRNIGNQDFVVGAPPAHPSLENDIWEYDLCHQHWHYESYAQYLLYNQIGNIIPVGNKSGFCLMDSECNSGGIPKYHCGYQGISAGCGDIYGWSLDCQWIDVTNVPSGVYRLVVQVNWTNSPDLLGNHESNYTNNQASVCLQLSRSANGRHLFQVLPDSQCTCTDQDNDNICADNDCNDNNPSIPTNPGTICNDGNPNTINDRIQNDGCSCLGINICTDQDNDNICANEDCDDNDPSIPTNPGTTCDDGNPNTINDRIQNDGCSCLGVNICIDQDNDGVCANDDCNDNNSSLPTNPGTICNDGNPNTINDRIQNDGCSCLGVNICIDQDNDGVCANDDCNDNNPSLPTNPGTICNDGNPNTINDRIQSDGCSCRGTNNNSRPITVSCGELTIIYGDGQIRMLGIASNNYFFKVHDLNNGWNEVFSCTINCGTSQVATVPNGFYKVKIYNANWVPICDTDIALNASSGSTCADIDGDGICANEDCNDNDPTLPATPNILCNDGNPNTINDVIQSDGCSCQGESNTSPTGTCDDITVQTNANTLIINGLSAPIEIVKAYRVNGGWALAGQCVANCGEQQVFSNLASGNYIIEVQFFNASWGTICRRLINAPITNTLTDGSSTFSQNKQITAIQEDQTIKFYPNPAKDILWLNLDGWNDDQQLDLTLLNALAQPVFQKQITHRTGLVHQVPLTTINNGIYFIQLSNGEHKVTKKLFIAK